MIGKAMKDATRALAENEKKLEGKATRAVVIMGIDEELMMIWDNNHGNTYMDLPLRELSDAGPIFGLQQGAIPQDQ